MILFITVQMVFNKEINSVGVVITIIVDNFVEVEAVAAAQDNLINRNLLSLKQQQQQLQQLQPVTFQKQYLGM